MRSALCGKLGQLANMFGPICADICEMPDCVQPSAETFANQADYVWPYDYVRPFALTIEIMERHAYVSLLNLTFEAY